MFTTLGATGMGSILKMLSGYVSSIAAAKADAADRELVRELERSKLSAEIQAKIFGGDCPGANFSRWTRRILAIIVGLTFMICTILCAVFPTIPLVTFATAAGGASSFSLLWGFITVPTVAAGATVVITTGHMLIVSFATISACFGFYFSPSFDRKR